MGMSDESFDPLAELERLQRDGLIEPLPEEQLAERRARLADRPPLVDPEEVRRMREQAQHPTRPLKGGLVVTNSDTGCDWCRGQHPDDEDVGTIDAESWVVLNQAGPGTYHVQCARELGWEPSEKAAAALEQYPNGPYA